MFEPRFKTLQDVYHHAVTTHARRPLFGVKQGGSWSWVTYAEFASRVDALRAALSARGIGKGDRVAVIADNRVEWAVACYASMGLGAWFVPMYEAQLTKDQAYILKDSGTKALFVSTSELATKIEAERGDLPDLEHVFVLDGADNDWDTLLAEGEGKDVPSIPVTSEDVAGFIYTSGTTGDPKGVLLTHGNFAANVSAAIEVLPLTAQDRSLSFLPWAHSFGQTAELHVFFASGASMGLAEAVPKIIDNLAEVRPTVLVSVPRIFNRIHDGLHKRMAEAGGLQQWMFEQAIANARDRRQLAEQGRQSGWVELKFALFDRLVFSKVRARFGGRLRYAISGGAALSPRIAEFIDDMGIVVYEGYGLTETSPVVAVNAPSAHRIGTVGRPLPGVRVTLDHDITGHPLDGEIIVHGHCVMKGYHGRPEETARVFTPDGGFRTGDMGRIDEDGFLSITGRIKEQYKLENGKYVVPSPLEEQLKLAPLVSSVLLYGHNKPYNVALVVPDWEVVEAWAAAEGVKGTPEALVQNEKLRAAIGEQLEQRGADFKGYERPRRFALLVEDFTTENGMLTPSLKVKRRVVLAHYVDTIESLYAAAS